MKRFNLSKGDYINIEFTDGKKSVVAMIPYSKLKELILDEAYEVISKPECNNSTCDVNGFCECDPINEDMEFARMYATVYNKDDKS